ncbi:TIGR03364 family FAD-dependent oxidoreductase [Glutamicibacter sp. NPDC087344]|uniref:TIGR03364 family FAD-dependent oxidoreductase n=1 Tax=Glutamicibacter sp. NPDC087344 TaxID=3363994 RepID=UPI0037F5DD5F
MNENTPRPTDSQPLHSDVLVVGAGIIGLAHAARALDAGYSVTVIDRDHQAVGASVRNFGHACITAQSGELYDIAQQGRPLWLEYAQRAGFWAAEAGAVVVAASETELQVLTELSTAREPGQVTLLSAAQVAAELGREDAAGIIGGARLRDDLRVDPRVTVAKLAAWLDCQDGGAVRWNTAALGFGPGEHRRTRVMTSRGPLEADQVFVCVGHDVDYLYPQLAADHKIRRCALQMARSTPNQPMDLGPAILTATSMLRYEAFTEGPSADKLRAEVAQNQPHLQQIEANVMFTQRPDGSLLLGDSHSYDLTQPPFLAESTTASLLQSIEKILGTSVEIEERWQGVYASSEVGPLLIAEAAPGVTVVSVTAGVGMTLSFGLAERNIASHLAPRQPLVELAR